MIAILICNRDAEELAFIDESCREHLARKSAEDLVLFKARDDVALADAALEERLVDLLYYDFRKGQSLSGLRSFRKRYGATMLMLITDRDVSPLEYLRPGISPDSLTLRPLEPGNFDLMNEEFLESYLERNREQQAEECFVVSNRDEKIRVPYSHIYYFEAREKKLFVRTQYEEYAFYETMEKLEKRLPEQFRRCHRSYIVNTKKIHRYVPGENYIELYHQIGVPVSRSYKSRFLEKDQ